MKKIEVTMTQAHEFTPEEINDLVVTALEGGINYWCGKANIFKSKDGSFAGVLPEDQDKVKYASDIIGYGGTLILVDVEDNTEIWTLTLDLMLKGIKMYCENENIALNELIDNHDADSADAIIQYALFDEIVFG